MNFKAGKSIKHQSYNYFMPNDINKPWVIDDMEIISLLSKADRQLGRLDTYSEYVNVDLFISMHIAKEASQSSRIEGTQTNMEEVFYDEDEFTGEEHDDWQEIQNYITAMRSAVASLEELPFSSRLIRKTHQTLMQGVRGEHKSPGEFRKSQNWIGGASIADAIFVPPIHNEISHLMSDLEKFAHSEDFHIPDLIKIAIIHYQFETIHPFLDGNGRVGRLIITLYLVNAGILKQPILYLSDFLEKHRKLYYENLMLARQDDNIGQWIKFFLVGVQETAKQGVETFESIKELEKDITKRISTLGTRAHKAQLLVNALYNRPVTNAERTAAILDQSLVTSYKMLEDFERLGILSEVTGLVRGKTYVFREYLRLFDNRS